jgi:hypothetical protein
LDDVGRVLSRRECVQRHYYSAADTAHLSGGFPVAVGYSWRVCVGAHDDAD